MYKNNASVLFNAYQDIQDNIDADRAEGVTLSVQNKLHIPVPLGVSEKLMPCQNENPTCMFNSLKKTVLFR